MAAFGENIVSDYVVVDIETTGLSPTNEEIIEIAAIKVIDNRIAGEYSTLVDPHCHIRWETTQLTGIDDKMVADAPDISEAMAGFVEFIGNMPLVGHNIIRFDMKFLEQHHNFANRCIDTLYMAQHIDTGSSGYTLTALCSCFGIINTNAHRALSDCEATHQIYQRLKSLYNENGAFITMSIACGARKYKDNIEKLCSIGTSLTISVENEKCLTVYADKCPVGSVSGGKMKEYTDNIRLVRDIVIDSISLNAKGKYLMSAKVFLK